MSEKRGCDACNEMLDFLISDGGKEEIRERELELEQATERSQGEIQIRGEGELGKS